MHNLQAQASPTPQTAETDGVGAPYTGHMPALDSLRGIAMLLVFLYHVKLEVTYRSSLLEEWDSPLQSLFRGLTGPAWVGVELFFVLSGFLITGILYDSKGRKHQVRNFYARRVLRIIPVYYVAILLALFVYPLFLPFYRESLEHIWRHQGWYWAHLVNVAMVLPRVEVPQLIGHFWSLSIEEHFYLLWPAVIWTLSRRNALALCVGLLLLCPIARLVFVVFSGVPVFAISNTVLIKANYVLTPLRLDAIAFGGAVALLVRGPMGLHGLIRPARRVLVASGLVLLAIMGCTAGSFSMGIPAIQIVGFTCLGLFFASLLVLSIGSPPGTLLGRMGESRVLHFLGKYSYAMYVFHVLPLLVLCHIMFGESGAAKILGSYVLGLSVFAALSLAATIAMALASWHAYEKRFIRMKRFFRE